MGWRREEGCRDREAESDGSISSSSSPSYGASTSLQLSEPMELRPLESVGERAEVLLPEEVREDRSRTTTRSLPSLLTVNVLHRRKNVSGCSVFAKENGNGGG